MTSHIHDGDGCWWQTLFWWYCITDTVASRCHQHQYIKMIEMNFKRDESSLMTLFGEFTALDTIESILWTVTLVVGTTKTCCSIVFWTFSVYTIWCIDPSTRRHNLLTIGLTTPSTMRSILDLLTDTMTTSSIAQMSTRCRATSQSDIVLVVLWLFRMVSLLFQSTIDIFAAK